MSDNTLSRRELLRMGGLTVVGATFLTACGKQANVPESANIDSVGEVPPTTGLPAVEVTDAVLMRTAASLEYNAIETYELVLSSGLLTGNYAKLSDAVKRFRDDHVRHAEAVNGLAVQLGSKSVTCGNARIRSLYIDPAVALITESGNPDAGVDVIALAHGLENLATQTYQGVVGLLSTSQLRAAAMRIGADEARHAVVLAQVLNPGFGAVGPTVNETTGKANVASVPMAFGAQSSVQVTIGAPNAEGVKTTVAMETPSLNSLVYDYVSC
jgi:sirohydrochlorin ferrochelatase